MGGGNDVASTEKDIVPMLSEEALRLCEKDWNKKEEERKIKAAKIANQHKSIFNADGQILDLGDNPAEVPMSLVDLEDKFKGAFHETKFEQKFVGKKDPSGNLQYFANGKDENGKTYERKIKTDDGEKTVKSLYDVSIINTYWRQDRRAIMDHQFLMSKMPPLVDGNEDLNMTSESEELFPEHALADTLMNPNQVPGDRYDAKFNSRIADSTFESTSMTKFGLGEKACNYGHNNNWHAMIKSGLNKPRLVLEDDAVWCSRMADDKGLDCERIMDEEINQYIRDLDKYCEDQLKGLAGLDANGKKWFERVCIKKDIIIALGGQAEKMQEMNSKLPHHWGANFRKPLFQDYDDKFKLPSMPLFADFLDGDAYLPDGSGNANPNSKQKRKPLRQVHYYWESHAYLVFPGAAKHFSYGGSPFMRDELTNPHRPMNFPTDVYISFHYAKGHPKFLSLVHGEEFMQEILPVRPSSETATDGFMTHDAMKAKFVKILEDQKRAELMKELKTEVWGKLLKTKTDEEKQKWATSVDEAGVGFDYQAASIQEKQKVEDAEGAVAAHRWEIELLTKFNADAEKLALAEFDTELKKQVEVVLKKAENVNEIEKNAKKLVMYGYRKADEDFGIIALFPAHESDKVDQSEGFAEGGGAGDIVHSSIDVPWLVMKWGGYVVIGGLLALFIFIYIICVIVDISRRVFGKCLSKKEKDFVESKRGTLTIPNVSFNYASDVEGGVFHSNSSLYRANKSIGGRSARSNRSHVRKSSFHSNNGGAGFRKSGFTSGASDNEGHALLGA